MGNLSGPVAARTQTLSVNKMEDLDLTKTPDPVVSTRTNVISCGGFRVDSTDISTVRENVRVIHNSLNSFFGLLNSQTTHSFHSYFYENLCTYGSNQVLGELYREANLLSIPSRLNSVRMYCLFRSILHILLVLGIGVLFFWTKTVNRLSFTILLHLQHLLLIG